MDTRNTPYAIKRPANWEQVAAYSRGEEKSSADVAQQAFDELIENIKLANCVYFPDAVNSIMRRAPAKIEAENYGHGGYNVSYYVADSTQRAASYRVNEPVLTGLIDFDKDEHLSEQYIILKDGEWTRYTVGDGGLQNATIVVKAMAEEGKGAFTISLNGAEETHALNGGWQEITVSLGTLKPGDNEIILKASGSSVRFDWVDMREAE